MTPNDRDYYKLMYPICILLVSPSLKFTRVCFKTNRYQIRHHFETSTANGLQVSTNTESTPICGWCLNPRFYSVSLYPKAFSSWMSFWDKCIEPPHDDTEAQKDTKCPTLLSYSVTYWRRKFPSFSPCMHMKLKRQWLLSTHTFGYPITVLNFLLCTQCFCCFVLRFWHRRPLSWQCLCNIMSTCLIDAKCTLSTALENGQIKCYYYADIFCRLHVLLNVFKELSNVNLK